MPIVSHSVLKEENVDVEGYVISYETLLAVKTMADILVFLTSKFLLMKSFMFFIVLEVFRYIYHMYVILFFTWEGVVKICSFIYLLLLSLTLLHLLCCGWYSASLKCLTITINNLNILAKGQIIFGIFV